MSLKDNPKTKKRTLAVCVRQEAGKLFTIYYVKGVRESGYKLKLNTKQLFLIEVL